MDKSNEKLDRIINIAKLYYEQDKTQNEIAKMYNISRPLISRILTEAKQMGIVHIEIRSPIENTTILLNKLKNKYRLKGGILAAQNTNNNSTNISVAKSAIDYLQLFKNSNFGIGWGNIIGLFITELEKSNLATNLSKTIVPLLGNSGVSNRNYHSNELVRVFAECTTSKAIYLHAPAFYENANQMQQFLDLESTKTVEQYWENLDVAIINISNHPSVPDFATKARYQNQLLTKKAVGLILSYYYDADGNIISSDSDYTLQIPLEYLSNCKNVVALCSANVNPSSLSGALSVGIINHLIAPEELVSNIL